MVIETMTLEIDDDNQWQINFQKYQKIEEPSYMRVISYFLVASAMNRKKWIYAKIVEMIFLTLYPHYKGHKESVCAIPIQNQTSHIECHHR